MHNTPRAQDHADTIAKHAEMFANRLLKRHKHLSRWARRDAVSCYRVYDTDIPEVPVAVDWYEGHLHLSVTARGDLQGSEPWCDAMRAAAAQALDVDPARTFLKRRQRQKGCEQYGRFSETPYALVVHEGPLRFRIDLASYLDTGLFLDHRLTRAMVAAESEGRHVLNLFGYTGSFSVYAAHGGARTTTTVDLSTSYLEWARTNFALNNVEAGPVDVRPTADASSPPASRASAPHDHSRRARARHALIRDDVFAFLEAAAQRDERWDLVVLDPPTFSNSKRMQRASLDLQRDHVELLLRVRDVLAPAGVIYFSTNRRGFRWEAPELQLGLEELTARTTPPDFRGKPHRCWRLQAC